jgi:hypothetical protein
MDMKYACGDGKCIKKLSLKTSKNIPLQTPRHRWKDNIKMYLIEIG